MVCKLGIPRHFQTTCKQEGSLLISRTFATEATAIQQQLQEAAKERDELRKQMSQLLQQSDSLAKQVELLTKTVRSHGEQNLMYAQAAGLQQISARADFKPTRNDILDQPTHVSQIANRPLFELSMHGSHSANKERLLREIMQVEMLTWEEAHQKLAEMDEYNEKYYWSETMLYRIGLFGATIGGVLGSAMVFYRPVAEFYGMNVAGEELPEGVKDISDMTINQVGAWTWNWMEPMIGTASFVILCSQFGRAQMWKLNMRPYTEAMLRLKANRLARQYPQYDTGIVRAWAKHLPMVNSLTMPMYRRNLGWKRI